MNFYQNPYTTENCFFQRATLQQKQQIKELWERCFSEDRSGFSDFYFANRYDQKHTFVATLGNNVISAIHAPFLKMSFADTVFFVPYIQGVATDKEYRGNGIASKLMAYALNSLNMEAIPFCILQTYIPDFYKQTGWRTVTGTKTVPLKKLPATKNTDSALPHYVWLSAFAKAEKYLADLTAVYDCQQKTSQNFHVERNPQSFSLLLQDHFNDGGKLFLLFDQTKITCYALVLESAEQYHIREICFLDEKFFWQGIEIIRKKVNNKHATVRLCSNFLEEYGEESSNTQPVHMIRITDTETLLSALRCKAVTQKTRESEFINISDCTIKENNGLFFLQKNESDNHCQKVVFKTREETKKIQSRENILQITAERLTELFTGCYNFNTEKKQCFYFNELF